jgi:hypothetical protein
MCVVSLSVGKSSRDKDATWNRLSNLYSFFATRHGKLKLIYFGLDAEANPI